MRIGIIGAGGKSGRELTAEALRRGHEVTAIVRNAKAVSNNRVTVLERDLFNLEPDDLAGFDVVIDAFKAPHDKKEQHISSIEHLITVLERLPTVRLLVVGGAGSLYTDHSKTQQLVDTKDFPPVFFPDAANMRQALVKLKASRVNWTYLSPAAMFDPEGEQSGSYILGEDVMIRNKAGESYVSYADYALAMLDEVDNRAHMGKQFSVVSEQVRR